MDLLGDLKTSHLNFIFVMIYIHNPYNNGSA